MLIAQCVVSWQMLRCKTNLLPNQLTSYVYVQLIASYSLSLWSLRTQKYPPYRPYPQLWASRRWSRSTLCRASSRAMINSSAAAPTMNMNPSAATPSTTQCTDARWYFPISWDKCQTLTVLTYIFNFLNCDQSLEGCRARLRESHFLALYDCC